MEKAFLEIHEPVKNDLDYYKKWAEEDPNCCHSLAIHPGELLGLIKEIETLRGVTSSMTVYPKDKSEDNGEELSELKELVKYSIWFDFPDYKVGIFTVPRGWWIVKGVDDEKTLYLATNGHWVGERTTDDDSEITFPTQEAALTAWSIARRDIDK